MNRQAQEGSHADWKLGAGREARVRVHAGWVEGVEEGVVAAAVAAVESG